MATERNTESVLAKLMGIDRRSHSHTTHERRRVLSENYFRNIASIAHRERSLLDLDEDEDDFNMDVDGHLKIQDDVRVSEGISSDKHHNLLGRNDIADLTINSVNSSVKNKLEKVRFLSQDQRYVPFERIDLQGRLNSCPRLDHLNQHSGNSRPGGGSLSSPRFLSNGRKQKITICAINQATGSQARRTKGLNNSIESPHGIAKQISIQVKQSVWHRSIDVSTSGTASDKSSVNKHDENIPLSSHLDDSENKNEASSVNLNEKSAISETQKSRKQLSARWKTRKFSQVRSFYGSKIREEVLVTYNRTTGNVNGGQLGVARYLSKPTLFPSAWVPRCKTREFTLDKNWCLRPGERDSKRYNEVTEENSGHNGLRSTYEPSGPSPDLKRDFFNLEAPLTPNGSGNLEEQNMLEDISTSCEPFSDMSNEAGDKHVEKGVCQEGFFESSLNCCFPRVSIDTEEVANEENEKVGTSFKFESKHPPAKSSRCVLLENRGSNFQDFCVKCELKNNVSEPRSPVSSLEGPEASTHCPNLIVESKETSSGCFENDFDGSEGFGMMVSSENRDFSYLVDVLTESGFYKGNLEMESQAWCSQGYVLNPLVFELLEKKYGKQNLWERSKRRLLFDRISSGLIEISRPFVRTNIWRIPVVQRFCLRKSREMIEDELWALLVNQEEEFKRESSDKLCRRQMEWLELEEDTHLIVQEIESLLIDELIEEFVSLEIHF